MPERHVRITRPHKPDGAEHEWWTDGERVKADCRGHRNPRMLKTEWTRWRCSRLDCDAEALVHDDATRKLIHREARRA